MAKERIIDVPQTKGTFEVVGIVNGTLKDNFYKELKTKTNKAMRMLNFGIEFNKGKNLYVNLMGMEQDNVFFSGKEDKNDTKNTTYRISWNDRLTFQKDGFRIIGVNCGLSKNSDGKNVNATMTQFDACKVINDNLEDGMSVFIRGEIEYSTYQNNTQVKYSIQQISLTSKPIDFDSETFVEKCNVTQSLVVTKLESLPKAEERLFTISDGSQVTMARMTAQVVSYDHIEEFISYVANVKGLCKTINTTLKKNGSFGIEFLGVVHIAESVEDVEEDDGWGEVLEVQKVKKPTTRDLYFNKAISTSLNVTDYTVEKMDEAIVKISKSKKSNEEYADANAKSSNSKYANDNVAVELETLDSDDASEWE